MEDSGIIELYFARSEQAIAETAEKYGRLLGSLARNILGNEEDAEECVNDAYLGVWNTIPPERPQHLMSFLCRIARNIAIKKYNYNTAQMRSSAYTVAMEEIEEALASPEDVESEITSAELAGYIEAFLDSLSPENRYIFMRRYWFSDEYEAIAKKTGLTVKNISVRLTRLRRKLGEYLKEKEYLPDSV